MGPRLIQYELSDFTNILDKYGLAHIEKDLWLQVGNPSFDKKWLLFISVINHQATELLNLLIPILAGKKISFRLIKSPLLQRQINLGLHGLKKIGKVVTLFPASEKEAKDLIELLAPLLNKFRGPKVIGTIQVRNNIYASYSEIVVNSEGKKHKRLSIPSAKLIPFKTDNKSLVIHRRKFSLGKFYIPLKQIRSSSKGNIYKAVSLKDLSFRLCIIKQGRLNMVDDYAGRTIRNRLEWQKKVNEDLYGKIKVPKVIDFFEENEDSYLVMEYIRCRPLSTIVQQLLHSQTWNDITLAQKLSILTYFLQTLEIINTIHANGYIHRDIKDSNLMVLPDGNPFIIDFELSYSIKYKFPAPPFGGVQPGYQAPEQLRNDVPTQKEDIFSVGGILIFLLTGIKPEKFFSNENRLMEEKLMTKFRAYPGLLRIIRKCLNHNPNDRPELKEIIAFVMSEINNLRNTNGYRFKY